MRAGVRVSRGWDFRSVVQRYAGGLFGGRFCISDVDGKRL